MDYEYEPNQADDAIETRDAMEAGDSGYYDGPGTQDEPNPRVLLPEFLQDELDGMYEQLGDIRQLTPREVGALGECIARFYLKNQGLDVVESNYTCPFGEADIICTSSNTIILVEVKTRRGVLPHPEEAMDECKYERYIKIGACWAKQHGWDPDRIRIDVIGINLKPSRNAAIRHLVNLSEPMAL